MMLCDSLRWIQSSVNHCFLVSCDRYDYTRLPTILCDLVWRFFYHDPLRLTQLWTIICDVVWRIFYHDRVQLLTTNHDTLQSSGNQPLWRQPGFNIYLARTSYIYLRVLFFNHECTGKISNFDHGFQVVPLQQRCYLPQRHYIVFF